MGGITGYRQALARLLRIDPAATRQSILEDAAVEAAFDGAQLRAAIVALESGTKTDVERAAKMAVWLAGIGVFQLGTVWWPSWGSALPSLAFTLLAAGLLRWRESRSSAAIEPAL